MLEFEIPPVLIARLIGHRIGDEGVEFCDSPSVLDIVVAEAAIGKADASLTLNAGWRMPPHAVRFK